jgi:VWFA-related protein
MLSRFASLAVTTALVLQPIIAAQQPAASADNVQPSTIRSTTRLVQVSVVALDNHGNPITGLTKGDFTLSDQGTPQTIAVFSAETPASSTPSHPLPTNIFTNRYELKGQDPGAVTVILFDALNSSAEDQSYARKQILKFLQTLKPQDHVAIYALTTKLLILHDFTQDSGALVDAVRKFSPQEIAAFDASTQGFIDLVGISGDPDWAASPNNFQANLNNANGAIADQNLVNRVISTASALEAIANHVAVIPGRKSLVWVSGGFPLQIGLGTLGQGARQSISFDSSTPPSNATTVSKGPNGGGVNMQEDTNQPPTGSRSPIENTADINRAARALNRANMSIYPVDVHGVELNTGMSVDTQTLTTDMASTGFFDRQNRLDSFKALADRTGGVAFYGNNDIGAGIHRAFEDGRYAYTIGFYPDHNTWNGKFREIKLQLKTPGSQLRYRKGYFAVQESVESVAAIKTDLQLAAISPLESTNIGIVVTGNSVSAPEDRKLELRVALDPRQFLLQNSGGYHKGALDMMFIQNSPTGEVLAAESQHFDIKFTDKQYSDLTASGIVLLRHLTVAPQATELRIVVRDAGSSALGSVAIPVKTFFSATAPTTNPPPTTPS